MISGDWMSKEEVRRAKRFEEDKADAARKKVKADQVERAGEFEKVLSGESSKGCCETCNYLVRTNDGKYQPCKMGHADTGPDKEICDDSSDPRYRPHARAWYKR